MSKNPQEHRDQSLVPSNHESPDANLVRQIDNRLLLVQQTTGKSTHLGRFMLRQEQKDIKLLLQSFAEKRAKKQRRGKITDLPTLIDIAEKEFSHDYPRNIQVIAAYQSTDSGNTALRVFGTETTVEDLVSQGQFVEENYTVGDYSVERMVAEGIPTNLQGITMKVMIDKKTGYISTDVELHGAAQKAIAFLPDLPPLEEKGKLESDRAGERLVEALLEGFGSFPVEEYRHAPLPAADMEMRAQHAFVEAYNGLQHTPELLSSTWQAVWDVWANQAGLGHIDVPQPEKTPEEIAELESRGRMLIFVPTELAGVEAVPLLQKLLPYDPEDKVFPIKGIENIQDQSGWLSVESSWRLSEDDPYTEEEVIPSKAAKQREKDIKNGKIFGQTINTYLVGSLFSRLTTGQLFDEEPEMVVGIHRGEQVAYANNADHYPSILLGTRWKDTDGQFYRPSTSTTMYGYRFSPHEPLTINHLRLWAGDIDYEVTRTVEK